MRRAALALLWVVGACSSTANPPPATTPDARPLSTADAPAADAVTAVNTPDAAMGAGPDAAAAADSRPPAAETGQGFRIYFIDTEGGGATLLISPTGETLLADFGWVGNRDAARILAALDLEQPGRRRIDYMLATHYHDDHMGAGPILAKSITAGTFINHGPNVPGNGDNYPAYRSALMAAMGDVKEMTVVPGQTLAFGPVTLTIISAAEKVIENSPSAVANPACAGTTAGRDVQDEDPQSIGFVARYGAFDFVDTGDLTVGVEHDLACPMNQVGKVEIFQSGQHGTADANSPEFVFGLGPDVIVVNNGPSKGGSDVIFERFKASPGLKDLWAIHRSQRYDDAHNAPAPNTGNIPGSDGNWLRAEGHADGTFIMTNGRTMMTKTYP